LPDSLKQLADWFTQVYTYSEAETTALAETEARQRWIQTLRQEQAMETLMPEALEKPIKLNYPLKSSLKYQRRFMACLSQTPKPVALGVFSTRRRWSSSSSTPISLSKKPKKLLRSRSKSIMTARLA
jgi:hypothetical protein